MHKARCLVTFFLAIAAFAGMAQAQHHLPATNNNNSQPHAFQTTYPGTAFANVPGGGYGGITFPNNNTTFPHQGLTFPSNNITFPTYASNAHVSNAPNYNAAGFFQPGTGYYGSYTSNGKQTMTGTNGTNPALLMGTAAGLGSIVTQPTQHYNYTYRPTYARTRTVYHTAHTYTPRNTGPQISPAERHFNSMVQDLDTLVPQFHAVDYHRNMIRNDILGLVSGKDRPPVASVQQLANSLTNAMVTRTSQPIDTATIASQVRTLVNGGNYSQTELKQSISQTEQKLREGGIQNADIKSITAAMNSVAGHFQSFSAPGIGSKTATTAKLDDLAVKPAAASESKDEGDILDKLKDKSIIPPGDK